MCKTKPKNEGKKQKKNLVFLDVPVNPSTLLLTGGYENAVDNRDLATTHKGEVPPKCSSTPCGCEMEGCGMGARGRSFSVPPPPPNPLLLTTKQAISHNEAFARAGDCFAGTPVLWLLGVLVLRVRNWSNYPGIEAI